MPILEGIRYARIKPEDAAIIDDMIVADNAGLLLSLMRRPLLTYASWEPFFANTEVFGLIADPTTLRGQLERARSNITDPRIADEIFRVGGGDAQGRGGWLVGLVQLQQRAQPLSLPTVHLQPATPAGNAVGLGRILGILCDYQLLEDAGSQDIRVSLRHDMLAPEDWNHAMWTLTVLARLPAIASTMKAGATTADRAYEAGSSWLTACAVYQLSHRVALLKARLTYRESDILRDIVNATFTVTELADLRTIEQAVDDMHTLVGLPQHAYSVRQGYFDPRLINIDATLIEIRALAELRRSMGLDSARISQMKTALSMPLPRVEYPAKPTLVFTDTYSFRPGAGGSAHIAGAESSTVIGSMLRFGWITDSVANDYPWCTTERLTIRSTLDMDNEFVPPPDRRSLEIHSDEFFPYENISLGTAQGTIISEFSIARIRVTATIVRNCVFNVSRLLGRGFEYEFTLEQLHSQLRYVAEKHDILDLQQPVPLTNTVEQYSAHELMRSIVVGNAGGSGVLT